MHNLGVRHCGAPRQRNRMQISSQFTRVSQYFSIWSSIFHRKTAMRTWIVFLKISLCFLSTPKFQKCTFRGDSKSLTYQSKLGSISSDQFSVALLLIIGEAPDVSWNPVMTSSSGREATWAWRPTARFWNKACYLCINQDYRREACGSQESAPFPEDEWPTRKHLGYHWKRRHHFSSTLLGM